MIWQKYKREISKATEKNDIVKARKSKDLSSACFAKASTNYWLPFLHVETFLNIVFRHRIYNLCIYLFSLVLQKQLPCFLSSRKEFSVASQPNSSQRSTSPEKPSGSGNNIWKLVLGSVAVGVAVMAAYQSGYIGHHQEVKEDHFSFESSKFNTDDKSLKDVTRLEDQASTPSNESLNPLSSNAEDAMKTKEAPTDLPYLKDVPINREGESPVEDSLEMTPAEEVIPVKEKDLSNFTSSSVTPDNQDGLSEASTEYNTLEKKKSEDSILDLELSLKPNEGVDGAVLKSVMEDGSLHPPTSNDMPKVDICCASLLLNPSTFMNLM